MSGWAAGIGALVAAWLTVPHLKRQANEARRQANFLYGDAPPTLDIVPDLDDPELLVVRVVNWNRRTIVAKSIEVHGMENGTLRMFDQKKNGEKVTHRSIFIAGWENRSAAPNSYEVRLAYEQGSRLIDKWPTGTEVTMTFQMLDRFHETVRLHATFMAKQTTALVTSDR